MSITLIRSIPAAAAALALVLGATAITAQAQAPAPTPAPAETQFDEPILLAFAQASAEVEAISTTWAPRITEAPTNEEAQQLQQQANTEMVQAVRSAGLDVETYNQIFQAAQADPQLANTISTYREQLR